MTTVTKLDRYKDNLSIVNENGETYVQSYSSRVARVEGPFLRQLGWWSTTTQRHINYAAKTLGLELIKK